MNHPTSPVIRATAPLLALALALPAVAGTINTGALSQNGWYSDDTRADGTGTEVAGTNLVSDTLTDDPEATASGTSAHDADTLSQIVMGVAPGTVPAGTHPGAVHLQIAAGSNPGKSQISHRKDDGVGHADGTVFAPGFFAEYAWMGDGTPTVTASLKFGIKTSEFGLAGVSPRTGENVWDKVLIYEPGQGNGNNSDGVWDVETIDWSTGRWWYFDRVEFVATIGTPLTLEDMSTSAITSGSRTIADVFALISDPSAHITAVQFGIGSSNAGGSVYVNQLETSFYRAGDVTVFGGPVNDGCADALAVDLGTTAFDTTTASTDGPDHPGCGFPGDDSIHNDVWYAFTAPCDGDLTASTCGTGFDTRLAVYDGCACPVSDAELIACNDDDCGTASSVTTAVTGGACYLVRVGGASAAAAGPGTLELSLVPAAMPSLVLSVNPPTPPGGFGPGDTFQVRLSMEGLCLDAAAGFQAFLEFDPGQMTFVTGSYTNLPFGLPVIFPIAATPAGEIDLASGINTFAGDPPTTDDAILATLTFMVPGGTCVDAALVDFRSHIPRTRLTDLGGTEIVSTLVSIPELPSCIGDVDDNGIVEVADLVALILAWNTDDCAADFDGNAFVDVADLVALILAWGPCP